MSRGKQVGNFVIGERIGQGTFSNVYLCRERLSPTYDYAVKVVNKTALQTKGMCDAFDREVQALRTIKSSLNVVNLIAVLQSARNYYLVMDLAASGTLLDRVVGAQRLATRTARKYFRQLLQGMNAIHSSGIAHRDIKLENLLIDARDVVKISDFTFACTMYAGKVLHRACGSPHYIAPEVISGEGYCGYKADVWSSGVCLYVMLVGRLPFIGLDEERLLEAIKTGKYEVPPTVSPGARDLLSHMLCRNPAERYTVPQLLVHPWVLGNESTIYSYRISSSKQQSQQSQQNDDGSSCSSSSNNRRASIIVDVEAPLGVSRSCPDLSCGATSTIASRKALRGETPPLRMQTPASSSTPPTTTMEQQQRPSTTTTSAVRRRVRRWWGLICTVLSFVHLCVTLGVWVLVALFFDVRNLPERFRNVLVSGTTRIDPNLAARRRQGRGGGGGGQENDDDNDNENNDNAKKER
eukprot:PhM_4_TR10785/c0_g1_i1/m.101516/K07198/PRKAA, AMPK; 5'-AMP-activated protein kinase, catalytic alpha subunit